MKYIFFLLSIALITSCAPSNSHDQDDSNSDHTHADHDEDHDHDHDHDAQKGDEDTQSDNDGLHFGETIDSKGAISYEELMTRLSSEEEVEAKVVAEVAEVCQAKGCWMHIISEDGASSEPIVVKFKDYGFFVPKDIAGRKVAIEGKAFKEVTSVDELRHYAEDAGKSKEEIEAISEPKEELKFVATGVLLLEN